MPNINKIMYKKNVYKNVQKIVYCCLHNDGKNLTYFMESLMYGFGNRVLTFILKQHLSPIIWPQCKTKCMKNS